MAKAKYHDPKGQHVRIYATLLKSPAYQVLSHAAKALFLDLRISYNGTNNGNISATLADMKHKGWRSSATLFKALYELRAMGFIAVTRMGGLKQGGRVCSLYRFTDLEVYDRPKIGVMRCGATHDYLRFKTLAEAKQHLRVGVAELRQVRSAKQVVEKKAPVLKLHRQRTETEREPAVNASISA